MLKNIRKNAKYLYNMVRPGYVKPVLGRWSLEYGEKAGKRADLTNEDHCGVCDKMRVEYIKESPSKKQ
mgnify:CR=1 FL=1|tara:strand:- start:3057 stop:3260 length:204 start_codon:yes stop_codon:yes gene_type:complete